MNLPVILLAASLAQTASGAVQDPPEAPAASTLPGRGLKFDLKFELGKARKPLSFQFVGNLVFFKAVIAGREVSVLLDTGAEHCLIDSALVDALGLETISREGRTLRTLTGRMPYNIAPDVPLEISGQVEGTLPIAVTDLSGFSALARRPVDAVLGADFLRGAMLNIDPVKRTLDFIPATVAGIKGPVDPIKLIGERSQLVVQSGDQPLTLIIDTGFNGDLFLSSEAWRRVAPKGAVVKQGRAAQLEGKAYTLKTGMLAQIELGGVTRSDVDVSIGPVLPGDGDGMIGMGLLRHFQSMLDLSHGQIWLIPSREPKPASETPPPPAPDEAAAADGDDQPPVASTEGPGGGPAS